MKNLNTIILMLFCAMFMMFLVSCGESGKMNGKIETDEKVRYFTGLAYKKFPLEPSDEISKEESLTCREAYSIVTYNEIGQIMVIKLIAPDGFNWSVEYEYHKNGKVKRERYINPDGDIRIRNFDKKGRKIIEN